MEPEKLPCDQNPNSERPKTVMKYRGVRMRSWGKWVCEIRLPNSRERVWLGSYSTPEEAAKAYDAAVIVLRGGESSLNFPQHPPPIVSRCRTSRCLQATAAFAASFATACAATTSTQTTSNHTQQCQCTPDTLGEKLIIKFPARPPFFSDGGNDEPEFQAACTTSSSSHSIIPRDDNFQQDMPQFDDLPDLCWVDEDLRQHGLVATSTRFTSLYRFDVEESCEEPALWHP